MSAYDRTELPKTERDLAKWLIYPYVIRGDSLEYLRRGGMGFFSRQIGDVEIRLDKILVRHVGPHDPDDQDWTVKATFKLKELYDEILHEHRAQVSQPNLFDTLGVIDEQGDPDDDDLLL